MKLKQFKKLDWRSLKKFASPQSMDNMNDFIEALPQNTNKSLLIIVAIIWGFAGALGLYTTVKMQEFVEIFAEFDGAEAVLPVVPKIQNKPVSRKQVQSFVDELQNTYKGLDIKSNSSNITIRAKSTSLFGQFREAIGHVQNGGLGWRVEVEKLCVGRECKQYPLDATLKINKVSVERN